MTNVISEKQQKNTLRGKKGKKETIKNVLASPYTHYWPLLNNEDDNALKQILKNNLPIIEQKQNIPWKEIESIPREERREYRKKKNFSVNSINSVSEYMYFGINEVTKHLERNEAVSVLITNDVTPQLMIKHVVDLCVFKQIPVLVVPDLKAFLKESVGFPSAAIAVKKIVQPDMKVYVIHETINKISVSYPVPEQHVHSSVKNNFFTNEIGNRNEIKTEQPVKSVYLYRSSVTSGRVFIPRSLNDRIRARSEEIEIDATGFLSFSKNDDSISNYKSLVVKRVKGNPNRNKKKFETIKNVKKK